ncbi:heterokaryon incompatibility protein-domain-containing protein [Xylaria sp. FL1042]|nr:heterokaryon incompatibility protein-domain-containing protein [Xylaria sp. FL1042]
MLLINTQSLDLEEFIGNAIPRYAILSHTWGTEEVSFQEWCDKDLAAGKAGYKKIFSACQQARADGLQYLWVDTNCIDKKSSAELSEAINSMFAFYGNSDRCYVYLADFHNPNTSCYTETVKPSQSGEPAEPRELHGCRWFTRGWTLQELLAPNSVIFFDSKWQKVGEKQNALFCDQLSRITGIDTRHLESRRSIFTASVSERMSWVARRQTTREEDIAYCMLGIFGINMPLLYGEGSRAFLRLQEEIIRVSNDQTIFCWNYPNPAQYSNIWDSVLAPHPYVFADSRKYIPTPSDDTYYSLTNNGISIKLRGVVIDRAHTLALLAAAAVDDKHYQLALILQKQGSQHCRNPHERLRRIPWQIAKEVRCKSFVLVLSLWTTRDKAQRREYLLIIPKRHSPLYHFD